MPEQKIVTMPFGKHRGRTLDLIEAPYLQWCLRECHGLYPHLRAAIQAELAHRRAARAGGGYDHGHDGDGRRPADRRDDGHGPAEIALDAIDRRAVSALLSRLLANGIRVVARGDGAVHFYADGRPLPDELRAELGRLHPDLDALARWAAWESPTRRRLTPAAELLARLRRRGVRVVALPGCVVELSSEVAQAELDALSPAGVKELWFRVACGLPDVPAVQGEGDSEAASTAPDAPLNACAGLHSYCLRQASRADASKARHWRAMADAVAALRAGQAAPSGPLADLADWCRVRAARAKQRGQARAASRWCGWAKALGGDRK